MYIYKKQFHADAYFVALMLMVASLPLSKFGMSVMQFTLLGLWLWSGFSFEKAFDFYLKQNPFKATGNFIAYVSKLGYENIIKKFRIFFRNKAALVLVSLFLIHIFGLLHTSDFAYAFKDLRIKLPLLAFPIILSTMKPLEQKKFFTIMLIHAAAVLAATFFSTAELMKGEFSDIRKISVFISPIRFSLNICIAIFTLLYFAYIKDILPIGVRVLFVMIVVWLAIFLVIIESGIGLIILITLLFLMLLYFIYTIRNLYLKIGLAIIIIGVPVFLYTYVNSIINEFNNVESVDFKKLDKFTAQGNKYVHDTIYLGIEDGKYVGLYLSMNELRKAWNERSSFDFDGRDRNDQEIRFTIIRFLTSKDYRKDAKGIAALTDDELRAIERGIANVNYIKNPRLRTRISKIMLGYHNFKYEHDPNGSSVLQRIEFWKASLGLIREHLVLGVGTGDLEDAFNEYYEETNSPLKASNRWRSHNQYLSIFVGLGLFGFLWFIFTLLYPPLKEKKLFEYFYAVFFVTMILSMLTEDTIETQAGVTLFAFFNSFLLFCRKSD